MPSRWNTERRQYCRRLAQNKTTHLGWPVRRAASPSHCAHREKPRGRAKTIARRYSNSTFWFVLFDVSSYIGMFGGSHESRFAHDPTDRLLFRLPFVSFHVRGHGVLVFPCRRTN